MLQRRLATAQEGDQTVLQAMRGLEEVCGVQEVWLPPRSERAAGLAGPVSLPGAILDYLRSLWHKTLHKRRKPW